MLTEEQRLELEEIRKEFTEKCLIYAPNSIWHGTERAILDTETGFIYSCKKEASNALGIKERTLKAKLVGQIKNNTSLCYADTRTFHIT